MVFSKFGPNVSDTRETPMAVPGERSHPRSGFWGRRQFLELTASTSVSVLTMPAMSVLAAGVTPGNAPLNSRYRLDQSLTEEKHVTSYNNFYEFDSGRAHAPDARPLRTGAWRGN